MNSKSPQLPKGVLKSDLKYDGERITKAQWEKLRELGMENTQIPLWFQQNGGCFIPTLPISHGGLRSYAIALSDKKIWSLTRNQSIAAQYVYIRKGNFKRLIPLMETFAKGMADSQKIRDRISSRRAQGQLNRAAGLTSWRW